MNKNEIAIFQILPNFKTQAPRLIHFLSIRQMLQNYGNTLTLTVTEIVSVTGSVHCPKLL